MSKKKNKNKDLPKVHLSGEDVVGLNTEEVAPSLDVPQEVAVPDEELPHPVENHLYSSSLSFSQLIGKYLDESLSENIYHLSLVDTASNNIFDLIVSNDETSMATNMYPAYLVAGKHRYTKKDYAVFLNAKVYSTLPPGNQIFLKPFLVTLDKRLIPEELKYNSKGVAIDYDLTDPTDTLALFINVCNTSSLLKDKRIPHKKVYDFMHEAFTSYLANTSDNIILKEVKDGDLFG